MFVNNNSVFSFTNKTLFQTFFKYYLNVVFIKNNTSEGENTRLKAELKVLVARQRVLNLKNQY